MYELRMYQITSAEIMQGKDPPAKLRSINNFASVLSNHGCYEEAERIHRHAIAFKEADCVGGYWEARLGGGYCRQLVSGMPG